MFWADGELGFLCAQLNLQCGRLAGKTNSLDKNITIEVPEDRFGLYSCDILDPDVVCMCIFLLLLLQVLC